AAYERDYETKKTAAEAHDAEQMKQYEARKLAYEQAAETERQKWDRFAMCGVVPANIGGVTNDDVGKYLVPIEGPDDTIAVAIVSEDDLTLSKYIRAFGMIEAIREDGRPDALV